MAENGLGSDMKDLYSDSMRHMLFAIGSFS